MNKLKNKIFYLILFVIITITFCNDVLAQRDDEEVENLTHFNGTQQELFEPVYGAFSFIVPSGWKMNGILVLPSENYPEKKIAQIINPDGDVEILYLAFTGFEDPLKKNLDMGNFFLEELIPQWNKAYGLSGEEFIIKKVDILYDLSQLYNREMEFELGLNYNSSTMKNETEIIKISGTLNNKTFFSIIVLQKIKMLIDSKWYEVWGVSPVVLFLAQREVLMDELPLLLEIAASYKMGYTWIESFYGESQAEQRYHIHKTARRVVKKMFIELTNSKNIFE